MRASLFVILSIATAIESSAADATLAEKKAATICERVLALANAGDLAQHTIAFSHLSETGQEPWRDRHGYVSRVAPFDLNGDGTAELIGTVSTGGSCYSDKFAVLTGMTPSAQARSQYLPFTPEEVEADEKLRWAKWGAQSYLLRIEDEPIVVSGRLDSQQTELHLASWFREGIERPLCAFVATSKIRQHTVTAEGDGVCRAVERGNVAFGAWSHAPQAMEDALRKPLYIDVYMQRADLDADGVPDDIALTVHHSGAGCGSIDIGLRTLAADGRSFADSAIDRSLLKVSGRLRYGKEVPDFFPRLLSYDGRAYVLGRADGGVAISSFWNNTPKRWCEIKQTPQFAIDKFYLPDFKAD